MNFTNVKLNLKKSVTLFDCKNTKKRHNKHKNKQKHETFPKCHEALGCCGKC